MTGLSFRAFLKGPAVMLAAVLAAAGGVVYLAGRSGPSLDRAEWPSERETEDAYAKWAAEFVEKGIIDRWEKDDAGARCWTGPNFDSVEPHSTLNAIYAQLFREWPSKNQEPMAVFDATGRPRGSFTPNGGLVP